MEVSVKQRLIQFIKYKGIGQGKFEKTVGLSNGYINQLRHSPSPQKIQMIIGVYPDLNQSWLLTGEGEMLNTEKQEGLKKDVDSTPVYDIDATCGTQYRDIIFTEDTIIGHVSLPGISKDSCIVRANGDSMEPQIHDGNMVVIREIKSWQDIFYGQMYLILLDEYRMIKYIRRYEPDEENYIILRSENPKYDDIKLRKDKIRKLFIVENILAIKTQL